MNYWLALAFGMSFDAFPIFAPYGSGYCGSVNMEHGSNRDEGMTTRRKHRADFFNIISRKLAGVMMFAFAGVASSFQHFVNIVQMFCANRKMSRVDTTGRVTRVHKYGAIRNGMPTVKLKGNVRSPSQFSINSNRRITGSITRSCPQPAVVISGLKRFVFHALFERPIVSVCVCVFIFSHTCNL